MQLNVDSVSHWMATNRASENLISREYFAQFGEPAEALGDAELREVVAFDEVFAGAVGGHPMRNRIDVQLHFFGTLRLSD